jgi:hypothetical protein
MINVVLFICKKGRLCGDQKAWRASGASSAICNRNTEDLTNVKGEFGTYNKNRSYSGLRATADMMNVQREKFTKNFLTSASSNSENR